MPRILWFMGVCAGLVLGALLLAWAATGFSGFGMSGHGIAAMLLGVLFATLIGVGLMALIFQSHRSRRDEIVHEGQIRRDR